MSNDQIIRPVQIERGFTKNSDGSILYRAGETVVLCVANIAPNVPPWLEGTGKGWITAEYNMLPGSTKGRKPRERAGKVDGRTTEIQRLIGRSFRAVADLVKLGERSITIDCDVLQADGGTRTASITGGFLALVEALKSDFGDADRSTYPLRESLAAISVGIVDGYPVLDLDYEKDFAADVDMNVVMTGTRRFIEIQGTGEEATFSENDLESLLGLAKSGIQQLTEIQRDVMGDDWPF